MDMDQGMDRNTIARLGHALADLDPRTADDPAMLAELDQIQARNRRERMAMGLGMDQIEIRDEAVRDLGMDPGPAPEPGTTAEPRMRDPVDDPAVGLGGTDPASGAGTGNSVLFDPIKHYLVTVRDEDEPWPT
jgi:hypothetical protein